MTSELPAARKEPESILAWRRASALVQLARHRRSPLDANEELAAIEDKHGDGFLGTLLPLWIAENHRLARDWKRLPALFKEAEARINVDRLLDMDPRDIVLRRCANAFEAGPFSPDQAYEARQAHIEYLRSTKQSTFVSEYFHAAYLEKRGEVDEARSVFKRLAASPERHDVVGDPQRDVDFLELAPTGYRNANELGRVLLRAFERKDAAALADIASASVFAVGVGGGHFTSRFASENLRRLLDEMARSRVSLDAPGVQTAGQKAYLHTKGWRGRWFRGKVSFRLQQRLGSWHWTGIVVMTPTRAWVDQFPPIVPRTNQPLDMPIRAPWPAGEYFMAGGITQFIRNSAAIVAVTGLPFGLGIVAAAIMQGALAARRCGYGTRGFYYNSALSSTHQGNSAFAVDFTRYARLLPHINTSGGTPVLAIQQGFVESFHDMATSGTSTLNFVQVRHGNGFWASGTGTPPSPIMPTPEGIWANYRSRYLHLAGPGMIHLTEGMLLEQGARLGLINDTGNSALDHLHLSVHDVRLPSASGELGRSVRMTPFDGRQTLEDSDEGSCIRSSNTPVPP